MLLNAPSLRMTWPIFSTVLTLPTPLQLTSRAYMRKNYAEFLKKGMLYNCIDKKKRRYANKATVCYFNSCNTYPAGIYIVAERISRMPLIFDELVSLTLSSCDIYYQF